MLGSDLHWVSSPDYDGKAGNGKEEAGNLVALGANLVTSVDSQVPDDDKVSNNSNGIPTPLLGSFVAKGRKEAS